MNYLTTRKPIGNLFNLHNEMGRLFGDLLSSNDGDRNHEDSFWSPTVDISETEQGFEIHAELPGVSKDDVQVSVKDNLLTIKGEKRQDNVDDTKTYKRIERRYGTFERNFTLPPNFNADMINAHFNDGVLTLSIPKPEEVKPKEIPISTQTVVDVPQES